MTCLDVEEVNQKYTHFLLEAGDYVVSSSGTIGRIAEVYKDDLPCMLNTSVIRMRPEIDELDRRFLRYFLSSTLFQRQIESIAVGSAQLNYGPSHLKKMWIVLPPLSEQQSIAKLLGALDDKIELNRRMNATLEAMAQAVFKEWFVDGAKEEWGVKPLSFFGEIVCGKTPSKSVAAYYGGDVPFIKIPDLHGNTFVVHAEDKLSIEGMNSQRGKTLPPMAICVSCIATVGLVAMTVEESQTNQQINAIIPKCEEFRYYLFMTMRGAYEHLQMLASGGTATLNLNTSKFAKIEVALPPDSLLKQYHALVAPFFAKILSNQRETTTLAALRDTLLPKLMRGEVRVKQSVVS